jgi:predicted DNA binding CopG/RHH family protein
MKRNITIRLDEATIKNARIAAARRGIPVRRLFAEQIDVLAQEDDDYDRAMRHALAELEHGFDLDGGPYPTRETAYDR